MAKAPTLLEALRDVSDGWSVGEQEAYTLLSNAICNDGYQVVGQRPGWYYRISKPGRTSVVVPINPAAADFHTLLAAARAGLADG